MAEQVITQAFRQAMDWGQKGHFRGNLCVAQSKEGIVEIIQHLIKFALEGNLTEELLLQDVGIVVSFVLNRHEVFKAPCGGNYAS